ncbi:SRPBCC family protein [Planctomyces sp. SH-PL14]|uniref:DUF805 domain-containing protein n=1 Tax=Planctomyces sp. SH-PL14 TaxID=1632864 RepID=UPI00078DC1FB|nr:SRPBCC family protein [Planctomyces sp. SH-PL14]AMV19818.1 Polyketide cyclase / dehydrase and lipid transport [Planctomyces sp. SH-PL14]
MASARFNPILFLFGTQGTLDRGRYLAWGVGLMLLKYAVEAAVIGVATGEVYTPLDFFNPTLSGRMRFSRLGNEWLGLALTLWTIPFVWIAVAMSIRRCRDAGVSPWEVQWIFVPIVNFIEMIRLAVLSSEPAILAEDSQEPGELPAPLPSGQREPPSGAVRAALSGIAAGVLYALFLIVSSVYLFDNYGSALFFGTPFVSGAVGAFLFNRPRPRSLLATLGNTSLMVLFCCLALLLLALEGMICVLMALPIMVPVAWLGGLVGWTIARETRRPQRERQGLLCSLAVLPLLAGIEGAVAPNPVFTVESAIEIAAPPERVWETVIGFPPITREPAWFFRLGIACPERARIEGTGIGAIRHCEFTTGAFVEPITVWDPPRRLAFDVTEQPEPMFELTPYRHIHPPHLKSSFRSTRGEFRLEPLPADGERGPGTRLIGRTWYTLDMRPLPYWTVWSDALIHAIHRRVLEHIREVAEGRTVPAKTL